MEVAVIGSIVSILVLLAVICGAFWTFAALITGAGNLWRLLSPTERAKRKDLAEYYQWRKENPVAASQLDDTMAAEQAAWYAQNNL